MLSEKLAPLEISTHLWGISASTIICHAIDTISKTHFVDVSSQLETIRVNCSKDKVTLVNGCSFLSDKIGLTEKGHITPLGLFVLSTGDPTSIVFRIITSFPAIERFVNLANVRQLSHLQYSEFCTYFPEEANLYLKLLSSFGLIDIKRVHDEVLLFANQSLFKEFSTRGRINHPSANWTLCRHILGVLLQTKDAKYVDHFCKLFMQHISLEYVIDPSTTLNDLLKYADYPLNEICSKVFSTSMLDNLARKEVQRISQQISDTYSALCPINRRNDEIEGFKVSEELLEKGVYLFKIPKEKLRETLSQAMALSRIYGMVLTDYIRMRLDCNLEDLARIMDEFFPGKTSVGSFLTRIEKLTSLEHEEIILKEYTAFSFNYVRTLTKQLEKLQELANSYADTVIWSTIANSCLGQLKDRLLERISQTNVSPHYFVYTLLDPSAVGAETRDRYSSDNAVLLSELDKLGSGWPHVRTDNSIPYTVAMDRLLAKGIEGKIKTRELRIMTPYTDYELQNYVSMIRELIEKGFEVKILSRLARDAEPWRVFQRSFTKGLGERARNVEYRTYTRFKSYRKKQQLQRGKSNFQEFGVHAKLFIIGDNDSGATLLGSANILDNSFHWNPESGVYSEDRKFIESAKLFFDFVWELSRTDELQMWKMEKVPKGPFFPSVYH